MEVIDKLLGCVSNFVEVENCMEKVDPYFEQALKGCYYASITNKSNTLISIKYRTDIETVLDFLHDELNTGHWSEVPLHVRQAFTAATFIKVIVHFRSCDKLSTDMLKNILKSVDMGLLLGAPLNENSDLLNQCATHLTKELMELATSSNSEKTDSNGIGTETYSNALKRKRSDNVNIYEKISARHVQILNCPSIEHFNIAHFEPQIPVKIQGTVNMSQYFNTMFTV